MSKTHFFSDRVGLLTENANNITPLAPHRLSLTSWVVFRYFGVTNLNSSFTRTAQIKVSQLVSIQMLTEKYDKAKTEGCFVDELTDEFLDAIASGDRLERVGKWQVGFF